MMRKRVCFTGHRPGKLKTPYDYTKGKNLDILSVLYAEVFNLYSKGYSHFIVGCALGTDQLAYIACRDFKANGNDIFIEIAIPYYGFNDKWPKDSYGMMIHNESERLADMVTAVDYIAKYNRNGTPGYAHYKLDERNKYMVDHSDLVIAIYDESSEKSGTKNCIDYALKNGKEVINIYNKIMFD